MILYIGNKLAKYGINPTSIETLGNYLKERYVVQQYSDRRNPVMRILHMKWGIVRYAYKGPVVLVDTYSTSNFYYALMTAIVCRILRLKYIPMLRGGELPARLDRSPGLSKIIFGHSYRNIAPSGYLKYEFEKRGYQVDLIPNTIDLSIYPYLERSSCRPRLLYVRALQALYNPLMAIKVVAELRRSYPEVTLCMVGPDKDGSLAQCQELASELGVSDAITYTSRLSKVQWIELSREYDIFINTTHADNTPVSVIEAMALGLPIVSTNVGGVPYLVEQGKTGLLSNDDDVAQMRDHIISLIDNKELYNRMSRACRAEAERMGWEVVKNKWFELLG